VTKSFWFSWRERICSVEDTGKGLDIFKTSRSMKIPVNDIMNANLRIYYMGERFKLSLLFCSVWKL